MEQQPSGRSGRLLLAWGRGMSGGLLERARGPLATRPVLGGHNDLAWELRRLVSYDLDRLDVSQPQPDLQTDLPRLRAGGVGARFWSVYVPSSLQGDHAVSATLEQVDAVRRLVRRYPDALASGRPDRCRGRCGSRAAPPVAPAGPG